MLYDGGESARVYEGRWRVLVTFRWPDGTPGWHATSPGTYEDAAIACRLFGLGAQLTVSDGTRLHQVRVERALIVPVAA